MRKIFTTKKRIAIVAVAGAAVLATGGTAFAYFTASGTGTGSASVGTTGTWNVTETTSGGPLYPGSGTVVDTFTIQNTGTGDQKITSATLSMASDTANGYAEAGPSPSSSTDITDCKSTWFNAAFEPETPNPTGTQVAGGQSITVKVDVTMPSDSTDNQDSCESSDPAVLLAIA